MLHAAHTNNVQVKDNEGVEWKLKTPIEQTSDKLLTHAKVTEVSVKAGGCGIHDGRLWHGSN